jgi:hypothetical protein
MSVSATFNENPSTSIAIENKKNELVGEEKQTLSWISYLKPRTVLHTAGAQQLDLACPSLVYLAD